MAATGVAPISVSLEGVHESGAVPTTALLAAMLRAAEKVSDLIFSPGRPPQVEVYGQLVPVQMEGLSALSADDTRRIAADLIGNNKQAINTLREQGSCDISYGLPGLARFRVNAFIQRGSCAVVMRVIPTAIPEFEALHLPAHLGDVANLRNGVVLVTGPTSSGKSSTVAALLDRINRERDYHIITIEDPIEFLHNHKKCLVNQREVHADTHSFANSLRAALREDPDVVLIGEMRDLETIESALRIAETGHLTLATLHTNSAISSINRIIDVFPAHQQTQIRTQLSFVLEGILCQSLLERASGKGRIMAMEVLVPNAAIRNLIREDKVHQIYSMMQTGQSKFGMQTFNQSLATLYHRKLITLETALSRSSNPDELQELIGRGAGLNVAAPPAVAGRRV